jgi:hypothetical protein
MNTATAKPFPAAAVTTPGRHQAIAERVGREILHRRYCPSAWASALVAARDSGADVTVEYARIRIANLEKQQQQQQDKAESLELRRLKTGTAVKSVRDLVTEGRGRPNRSRSSRPDLSLPWLLGLLLGSAGTIGCLIRLLGGPSAGSVAPGVGLLGGAAAAATVVALWALLPRRWVRAGYHLVLGSSTMAACLLSFFLGARLITTSPQHWQLVQNRLVRVSPTTGARLDGGPPAEASAPPGGEHRRDTASLGF